MSSPEERLAKIDESFRAKNRLGVRDVEWLLHQAYSLRSQLLERDERITQLEAYVSHLQWCRSCAEDPAGTCYEGSKLKELAFGGGSSHTGEGP